MTINKLFPITRSTPSAKALTSFIQANYAVKEVHCRLIKGFILHTYLITSSNGRFILRIYPHSRRTGADIQEELSFLQHLNDHNIPVSTPIPTQDGGLQLTLNAPEGPRQAVLFTFGSGKPFHNRQSEANIHTFGRLLAQMHQAAQTFPTPNHRRPLNYNTLVEQPLALLEKTFPDRHADWQFLRQIAPELQASLSAIPNKLPHTTLIHGDMGSTNVHIDEENRFTLFDFDFCGPGPRAYDIATFLIDESPETAEILLSGYQTISALNSAEIQALPHLQITQHIWLLALRADYVNEWGTTFFSDHFVNNILQTIKALCD